MRLIVERGHVDAETSSYYDHSDVTRLGEFSAFVVSYVSIDVLTRNAKAYIITLNFFALICIH